MRLEQLMQIVEIDHQRSLSQAAKRLFISQPSLSISVNNLEEELGFKIFHRSNTGVIPTDLGQEVLRLARNVISEIEQMKDLKTGNANIRGNVHFAITPVMANSLAPELIRRFRRLYPNVQLLIEEQNTHTILDMLAKGACNIAYSGCSEPQAQSMLHMVNRRGIAYEITNTSRFRLLISGKNPLAQGETFDPLLLKDMIVLNCGRLDNSANFIKFADLPTPAGYLMVFERETLKRLIADDEGVAIFPDFFGLNDPYFTSGMIKSLPIDGFDTKGLHYILYNEETPLSFLEEQLLDVLRLLLNEMKLSPTI